MEIVSGTSTATTKDRPLYDVLSITQDYWLSGVDIKTAGNAAFGYNSSLLTAFVPTTDTVYFEIALGNVTDWTLFNTGASAGN